ncbi:MAG: hypothetical protein IAE88_04805 [Rhodobacteraceae bacterium]|nr:hypothetical protein [Paracoccaceae bacterium]
MAYRAPHWTVFTNGATGTPKVPDRDPLPSAWYLPASTAVPELSNFGGAWKDCRGTGVAFGVVADGADNRLSDLAGNYRLSLIHI